MKHAGLALMVVLLSVAGATAFLVDRVAASRAAAMERDAALADLEASFKLAARHPRAFGPRSQASGDSALKTLAQETARARGVTIGFLSESDREAEKGRRERQVIVRLVDTPHPGLVWFLSDLEEQGLGTRVKELHLRPSKDGQTYEEAEIVLSKIVPGEKP
jgi:hypothetical protein